MLQVAKQVIDLLQAKQVVPQQTVEGLVFDVVVFSKREDLTFSEGEDEAKIESLIQSPAFADKEHNIVFINKPIFSKLKADTKCFVLTHELFHLRYPDMGEIETDALTLQTYKIEAMNGSKFADLSKVDFSGTIKGDAYETQRVSQFQSYL